MIAVTYTAVDGYTETKSFATRAEARAFAVYWIGETPEIGRGYAISGDGVGKITATGIDIAALFAPDAEGAP